MRDHLGYENVFPIWYQNCNKKLSDVSRNVRTPERIICMATSMNCEIFSLQVIKKLSPEMSGPEEYIHRHLKYQLYIVRRYPQRKKRNANVAQGKTEEKKKKKKKKFARQINGLPYNSHNSHSRRVQSSAGETEIIWC